MELDGLVRFMDVQDSAQDSDSGNHVRLKLLDGTELELADQEAWGDQALVSRPAAPDSNGNAEAIAIELGDELVAFGTRDARNIPNVAAGEAVLRALGPGNVARVWVKPDGSLLVETTSSELGSAGATHPHSLGDNVKSYFDSLKSDLDSMKTIFDAHVHPDPVSGSTGATGTPFASATAVPSNLVSTKHNLDG